MKIFLILLSIIALGLPLLSFAAVCSAGTCETVADCDADFECIEDRCIGENNLNLCYPSFSGFNLAIDTELTEVIAWFYYGIVAISGLAAFVMIVWGGIQWMSAAGNPGATTDAKDKLWGAILGLLLILSSFIILRTINPELTTLQIPGLADVECIKDVEKDVEGNCRTFEPPSEETIFAVNDEEAYADVEPNVPFTLIWSIPKAESCEAAGGTGFYEWGGTVLGSGMLELSTASEGEYEFFLTCDGGVTFNDTVIVNVGFGGAAPGTTSVILKAGGFTNEAPYEGIYTFDWSEHEGLSDSDICIFAYSDGGSYNELSRKTISEGTSDRRDVGRMLQDRIYRIRCRDAESTVTIKSP